MINKQPNDRKRVKFCLTKQQHELVRRKAAKAGLTFANYLRQVGVNGQVKIRWTPEEREMLLKLTGTSEGVRELVTEAPKRGATETVLLFKKYTDIIDEVVAFMRRTQS